MNLTEPQVENFAGDLALYVAAFQGYEKIVGFPSELNTFQKKVKHFDSIYQTCTPIPEINGL